MAQDPPDKPPPRRIDVAAKHHFLERLRAGASRKEAAEGSGFSWRAFYQVRRRDPIFEFGWLAALELSAVDERDARRAAARLEERRAQGTIETGNRRVVQLKRRRRGFSFDERRQQLFLDFFAGTADEDSAADSAGVSRQTVRAHMRRHPEFAALRDEALQHAYARLEAEAVRQRLAAQQRLRDNLEPAGEIALEFERVMKLLARYDRKDGRIGSRVHAASPARAVSFEEAIVQLDKALDALAIPRVPLAPEAGEEGAGEEGGGAGGGGPGRQ
ncbi:MAG TPA: hypothetical protein VD846_14985 [Allosphingosinicella sp.]|nr:hypothetical protein [Allosphingosinicella sp.]